jgi:hypothetical protein
VIMRCCCAGASSCQRPYSTSSNPLSDLDCLLQKSSPATDMLLKHCWRVRAGSPTAMAVVYMALADAVGLRLEPVLLRSHMFLAPQGEQGTHVVDPYAYGALRTRADVARALAANEVRGWGCCGALACAPCSQWLAQC